ncbi:short chain dehydrogenase/reductase family [Metarhizium acridum CQMa 102]|uniref:Short chain dehydrogenase/reductase family n=1 Tax=Metarhizium acridum (strain CQMa 102) TaxID=655827 RepID=E9E1V6_METAQ|nr:short chain dehydrogenase/reductase family [Metarhizium acridum CQMa 102]EFY90053.1 short chain dehydrogenase/reductase family [Metarhizium acridum CQMa 102]
MDLNTLFGALITGGHRPHDSNGLLPTAQKSTSRAATRRPDTPPSATSRSLTSGRRARPPRPPSRPGGLHVLVNNAGAAWGADLDSHPDAAWTKLLTLSLQPAARLHPDAAVPAAAREGRQPGRPRARRPRGSIDGLHHLSRHIARDLGSRNVTTNVLACGRFRTRMMKATLDAAEDVLTENIPLRRIGRDEDVAGSAVFWRARLGVSFLLKTGKTKLCLAAKEAPAVAKQTWPQNRLLPRYNALLRRL